MKKTIQRRDFLKLSSLAGLGVVAPWLSADGSVSDYEAGGSRTFASYEGPLFVLLNAAGGWDPTLLCDPKGAKNLEEPGDAINRSYLTDDILTAGNIAYAPVGANDAFFQKYYKDLLVINGLDVQTNGHDTGTRHSWSGRLTQDFPSFGAIVAASYGLELPMSYLSFGGYDVTGGIVARTRTGNTNALTSIAYPGRTNPADPEALFHSERATELIRGARSARERDLASSLRLPRIENAQNLLFAARSGAGELKRLQEYLPDPLDNSGNRLFRQAEVAMAAFRSGLSIVANLSVGGFDTHGNHDDAHTGAMERLIEGAGFIMDEAERQGVADRLTLVIGSDFGRTPMYNENAGKDHWSVSSMMMMGPGISGNRVVGATDDGQRPMKVHAGSLKLDEDGIRIEPEHIHAQLRELAGVDDGEYGRMFPVIPSEDMPLLG